MSIVSGAIADTDIVNDDISAGNIITGASNAAFTVTITAPVGSSQFVVGVEHTITWSVSKDVIAWQPFFTTTGAAPWTAILAQQVESSPDTYAWTVAIAPSAPSATSRIKIECEDALGNTLSGTSALFEISATDTQSPSGTVTVPI